MAGIAATQVSEVMASAQQWASSVLSTSESTIAQVAAAAMSSPYTHTMPATYGGVDLMQYGNIATSAPMPGGIAIGIPPGLITITVPDAPSEPTWVEPTLGMIREITLPDIPVVSFPSIDLTPPIYDVGSPPSWNFTVGNVLISDDPLIMAMITRLTNNIVNGGTGLSPVVEAAIWARDLERNEQQLADTTDKVTTMWAKKGFSLPDGMLAHSLSETQKEYMNKMLDRSREIAIKQAELEQTNLFKSIELASNLMDKVIGYLLKYEELVLQAQELTAKFAYELIGFQLKAYVSKVEAYKATAQTYEMIIKAELAKIEVYKGQLDGQRLVGELNTQTVQIFGERQKAIALLVDRYKTQVQAMVSELELEKAKIEANKVQFDIWAKTADVALAKYQGETELFKASSMVNISAAELRGKLADATARTNVAYTEVNCKSYEAMITSMNAQAAVQSTAASGAATAAAHMAAGAMAAMSAHASMGYSENMSGEL